MKYFLICFGLLFSYRLITNICALIRLSYYDKKYTKYLHNQSTIFSENTEAIVQLFKTAGIKDKMLPFTQPSGYGTLVQGNASLFGNIGNIYEYTVAAMLQCFAEAKGTFKHRIIETFSPLFWVNCAIFLPRKLFEYLGVKPESFLVKLCQLLYWVITPILIAFRENLCQYLLFLFG